MFSRVSINRYLHDLPWLRSILLALYTASSCLPMHDSWVCSNGTLETLPGLSLSSVTAFTITSRPFCTLHNPLLLHNYSSKCKFGSVIVSVYLIFEYQKLIWLDKSTDRCSKCIMERIYFSHITSRITLRCVLAHTMSLWLIADNGLNTG